MSHSAKDLLIIYETEAEQWATYLRSVFTGPISESGICCYDIAEVSSRRDDVPSMSQYTCKLLILSKGMVEALSQPLRSFLARVLSPAAHVVVLLCGVETLTPLLELVPLNADECLQISSEQDANEYLSAVTDIVMKGMSSTAANVSPLTRTPSRSLQTLGKMHSNEATSAWTSIAVVPSRVPCGSSMEVFILLKNTAAGSDAEIEFTGENHTLRVTPERWNDQTLCVNAPDFPAGTVRVTVYNNEVPLSTAELQYYTNMEEVASLLSLVAEPVEFMCQALQVSSVEMLDQKLALMLLKGMPTGGFGGLHCPNQPERELHQEDLPSLLHLAARYGFKSVSSLLLQCPGARRALTTADRHGHTPTEIARSHGHTELHVLLKETLSMSSSGEDGGDSSVYELMCAAGSALPSDAQREQQDEEDEGQELYAPLGVSDEYDTIHGATKAVVIANRPPAPTPRPESTRVKEDKTPFIAKVFQKKKASQGDADLYSLPTKQARAREDSALSTYDTFVPNPAQGLQQRSKVGPPSADEASERFSNWPQGHKGMDANQQETSSQLRVRVISSRDDGDSVYDKINVVHHTPSAAPGKTRRGNKSGESDFYSTPLKGQHLNFFFGRADKR